MTEAQFQGQVIQLAEMLGWKAGHFSDSRRQVRPGVHVGDKQAAGIPDLVLAGKRLVWAELKTDAGRLSVGQRLWLDKLTQAGCEVYVWRPSDLDDVQRILGRSWVWYPRGVRHSELGRASGGPCLRDADTGRVWLPGSVWVAGRGRADEIKEAA